MAKAVNKTFLALSVLYFVFGLTASSLVSRRVAETIRANGWATFNGWLIPILAFLGGVLVGLSVMRIRLRRPTRRELAWAAAGVGFAIYTLSHALLLTTELVHIPQFAILTVLLCRAFPESRSAACVTSALGGVLDEWSQSMIPNRVLDLNDIFLNWVGLSLGLLWWWCFTWPPVEETSSIHDGSIRRDPSYNS